jgi:branched-chain amino acid transport system substrate-binding protein
VPQPRASASSWGPGSTCTFSAPPPNNLKIIKALEGHRMTAQDRMQHHDAWIDPSSHHVQQTIYVGARNFEPRDPTDLFKIIGMAKPEDVVSETEKDCKLETYEATPSYEM